MDTVEGQVVFRNRMGKATFMRVETPASKVVMLYFRKDDLGDAAYERVGRIDLFETIRVEVGPETQGRGGPFWPVIKFND